LFITVVKTQLSKGNKNLKTKFPISDQSHHAREIQAGASNVKMAKSYKGQFQLIFNIPESSFDRKTFEID